MASGEREAGTLRISISGVGGTPVGASHHVYPSNFPVAPVRSIIQVELFQEPIRRRYYAPYLSCSYLFFLLSVWVLLCLPFFLSYDTNFWLKTNTYREQPDNAYEYKILVQATGLAGSDNYFYSSVPDLNRLRGETLKMCSVKTREVDDNRDR